MKLFTNLKREREGGREGGREGERERERIHEINWREGGTCTHMYL